MARRPILEMPHPRLRSPAAPVTAFDADLKRLVDDLLDTLSAEGGIGLSAPQVDDGRRVVVLDLSEDGSDRQVFVNPDVVSKTALGIVEESCLSVPGVVGNVVRATEVRVRAQDASGAPVERDLSGMEAVCLLHEIDHLDGILFVDRLSIFHKLRLRAAALARSLRGRDAA